MKLFLLVLLFLGFQDSEECFPSSKPEPANIPKEPTITEIILTDLTLKSLLRSATNHNRKVDYVSFRMLGCKGKFHESAASIMMETCNICMSNFRKKTNSYRCPQACFGMKASRDCVNLICQLENAKPAIFDPLIAHLNGSKLSRADNN